MIENRDLDTIRLEIDEVNDTVLTALNTIMTALQRRQELVSEVTIVKEREGLNAHQPERFAQMLGALQLKANLMGVDAQLVNEIWTAIHDSSLRQQGAVLEVD